MLDINEVHVTIPRGMLQGKWVIWIFLAAILPNMLELCLKILMLLRGPN
jgi:hypothetical protein